MTGLSRPKLASLVGCSSESIRCYEEGRNCPDARWTAIQAVFAANSPVSHRVVRDAEQINKLAAHDGKVMEDDSPNSIPSERQTPMQRYVDIQRMLQEQQQAIEKMNENMKQLNLIVEFLLTDKVGELPLPTLPAIVNRKPKAG